MSENKSEGYVYDVVKEHTYQNQDMKYYEAYSKWRNDDSNPYSYSYTHDVREHSYVAGSGYNTEKADDAEQLTLSKCLSLLGVTMLIMLIFDGINYLLAYYLSAGSARNTVMYSHRFDDRPDQSVLGVTLFTVITVLKYVVPMIFFKVKSKVPLRVALPDSKTRPFMTFNSVVIMMMITVIGRMGSMILSKVLAVVKVDTVYIHMFAGRSPTVTVISAVLNCILIPVLIEVFFRGFILQSFRQFGDSFAIVVSSIMCSLSFYDISYIGFAMLCSAVLGVFTVRTGSLKTAIYMHMISTSCNYLLALIGIISAEAGRFLEIAVYMLVCAGALVVYSRLNNYKDWSYDIEPSQSDIPFKKKLETLLFENSVELWLVFVMVMVIAEVQRL